MMHDLADKAPEDLVDEWQAFLGALDDLDKALKDAGVKPADFQNGKPPAGLSDADQKAIAAAATQLAPPRWCRLPTGSSSRDATSARSTWASDEASRACLRAAQS